MDLHHETIRFERRLQASPERVFAAYLNTSEREAWSAPGEMAAVRIEQADVRTGGSETTRCGSKDDLRYRTDVRYHLVLKNQLICFSETVLDGDAVLTSALITMEFRREPDDETLLILTDQVTSVCGRDGIQGHRQGFSAALQNLASHLTQAG